MRLRFPELQARNQQTKEIRQAGLKAGWEELDKVLHYQGLLYVPKVIRMELISKHLNDLLAGYFRIKKTQELVAQKYYWPTLQANIKAYLKGCDVCVALKAVRHKQYVDLQLLPVPTH